VGYTKNVADLPRKNFGIFGVNFFATMSPAYCVEQLQSILTIFYIQYPEKNMTVEKEKCAHLTYKLLLYYLACARM